MKPLADGNPEPRLGAFNERPLTRTDTAPAKQPLCFTTLDLHIKVRRQANSAIRWSRNGTRVSKVRASTKPGLIHSRTGQHCDLQASLYREPHFPFGLLAIGVGDLDHEPMATTLHICRCNLNPVTEELSLLLDALRNVESSKAVAIDNFQ